MTKEQIKLVMQWCLPLDTTSKKLDELVETFANEHKEAINYTRCCKSDSEQLRSSCNLCNVNNQPKSDGITNITDIG